MFPPWRQLDEKSETERSLRWELSRKICVLHPLKNICTRMYAFLYRISVIHIYQFLCLKKHFRIIGQQKVYCIIIAKIVEKSFQTTFSWFTDYVMLFYGDICDVLKGPGSCGWEDLVWVLNTLLTFHGPQASDSTL